MIRIPTESPILESVAPAPIAQKTWIRSKAIPNPTRRRGVQVGSENNQQAHPDSQENKMKRHLPTARRPDSQRRRSIGIGMSLNTPSSQSSNPSPLKVEADQNLRSRSRPTPREHNQSRSSQPLGNLSINRANNAASQPLISFIKNNRSITQAVRCGRMRRLP